MRHSMDRLIDNVDCVIRFLHGHKAQAVDRLFLGATDGYKGEWLSRDVFSFWCHLDLHNQRELVEMALDYYGPTPRLRAKEVE